MNLQYQKIDLMQQKLKNMPKSSNDFLPLLDTLISTIKEQYREIDYKVIQIESQYKKCIEELEQNLKEFPLNALKCMGHLSKELYEYGQSKGIFKILEDFNKTNKISYSDYNKVRDYTKQSLAVLAITGGLAVLTGVGTWLWKKKKEKEVRKKIAEYISTHNSHLKENINTLRFIKQICKTQKDNLEYIRNSKFPQNDEISAPYRRKISDAIQIMNDAIYKIDRFISDPIVELIK